MGIIDKFTSSLVNRQNTRLDSAGERRRKQRVSLEDGFSTWVSFFIINFLPLFLIGLNGPFALWMRHLDKKNGVSPEEMYPLLSFDGWITTIIVPFAITFSIWIVYVKYAKKRNENKRARTDEWFRKTYK